MPNKIPSERTLIDSTTSSAYQYVGVAPAGSLTSEAKWQIQKIFLNAGQATEIVYADGNASCDNIWDDRDSLTYS